MFEYLYDYEDTVSLVFLAVLLELFFIQLALAVRYLQMSVGARGGMRRLLTYTIVIEIAVIASAFAVDTFPRQYTVANGSSWAFLYKCLLIGFITYLAVLVLCFVSSKVILFKRKVDRRRQQRKKYLAEKKALAYNYKNSKRR